jgi:hypothetical protein
MFAILERLIGTLRRECLDHVLIFGEAHLRQSLTLDTSYYNQSRTHLSPRKDAPIGRSVQRYGTVAATVCTENLIPTMILVLAGKIPCSAIIIPCSVA